MRFRQKGPQCPHRPCLHRSRMNIPPHAVRLPEERSPRRCGLASLVGNPRAEIGGQASRVKPSVCVCAAGRRPRLGARMWGTAGSRGETVRSELRREGVPGRPKKAQRSNRSDCRNGLRWTGRGFRKAGREVKECRFVVKEEGRWRREGGLVS